MLHLLLFISISWSVN